MAMTSRVKHSYDVDPKALFRALGSAAVVADGGSDVLSIHQLSAAYWQGDNEVADKRFDVVLVVEAITVTTGITISLQVDDAADMASAVNADALTDPAVGVYTFPVDADQLAALIADPSHVRMFVDLGASDSITYAAWIVPHAKA